MTGNPRKVGLRARLFLVPALLLLAAGALQAEGAYSSEVAVLGGIGGSPDVSPGRAYNNGSYELKLAMETEPKTQVGLRIGHLGLDSKGVFDVLERAGLTFVNVSGEYRFQESYYESGVFLGLGAYRLSGTRFDTGQRSSETAAGGVLGLTGEYPVSRRLSLLVEITAHYVDFRNEKIFTMGHAGLTLHF